MFEKAGSFPVNSKRFRTAINTFNIRLNKKLVLLITEFLN